jgi:hypothetical protein
LEKVFKTRINHQKEILSKLFKTQRLKHLMDENYERIISKISKSSGLDKEELDRRVEAKRAKLSGFISKEGAAQIVAAELNISFDDEVLKINELLPGMRKVNVVGKIINLFPVRTFKTKKGEDSKVVNFVFADDTSNTRVVLWDTNHIALIEDGSIKEGDIVEIKGGSMRDSEIHLGSFSEFKPSTQTFEKLVTERIVKDKNIVDFRVGDGVQNRAFIVQTFEPRFFYICPECRKKVVSGSDGFTCQQHGKVGAEKRALINIVIDDGSENIRAVLFSEAIDSLGLTDLENVDSVLSQRQSLLGKEMCFVGSVRNNKFFNRPEFIIEEAKEIDLDELIKKMEGK